MKGDFTRDSFDESKQYSQVLLQQGRVQLDADWNEAAAIAAHRDERALRDLIGESGSPDEGFRIAARQMLDPLESAFAPPSLPLQDILALDSLEQINGWSVPAPGTVTLDGKQPFQQRPTVRITGPGEGFKSFGAARNLRSYARIITVTSQVSNPKFFLKTQAGAKIKLQNITSTTSAGWITHVGDIPVTADLSQIVGYGFEGITAGTGRNVAQVLGVLNPAGNFIIYPGRLYVDGIACWKDHIETIETYYSQKAYPEALPLEPADNRIDLVYVDVFQRHITAIEDPKLREVALGGPDTCTRVQTVAQVKVLQGGADSSTGRLDCATLPADLQGKFDKLLAVGQGTLSTLVAAPGPTDNLCEIAADSDYLGLDNRLYRVEIHDAGPVRTARFKWSKNNGAIAVAVVEDAAPAAGSDPQRVRLERLGRDRATSFSVGDWVEISDDLTELADASYGEDGLPVRRVGELRQVKEVDPDANTITLNSALTRSYTIARHAKVRKWDGVGSTAVFVDTATTPQLDFGDGVQITFDGGKQPMLSGDYWQFTARGITGQIEKLDHAPPAGVVHHFCPLALIKWRSNASGVFEIVDVADCRNHFPALTDIQATDVAYDDGCCGLSEDVQILATSHGDKVEGGVANVQQALDVLCAREREYLALRYVGGDGQHGLPGAALGMDLIVAVENVLGEPQKDVQVNFEVQEDGSLSPPSSPDWKTDDNGEVRVRWTLGPKEGLNRVCASLNTPQAGNPEIIFNALGVAAPAGGGLCTITVGDGVNSHGQFNGYEGLVQALAKVSTPEMPGVEICILQGEYYLEATIELNSVPGVILQGSKGWPTTLRGPSNRKCAMHFRGCNRIELHDLAFEQTEGLDVSNEPSVGVVHFSDCLGVVVEDCSIGTQPNAGTSPAACLLIEGPDWSSLSVSIRKELRAVIRRNEFLAWSDGHPVESPPMAGIALRSACAAEIADNVVNISQDLRRASICRVGNAHPTQYVVLNRAFCVSPVSMAGGGFGIDLEDHSSDCVIANNIVVGVPPDPEAHIVGSLGGIHVGSGCNSVIVRGNHIQGGTGLGIALGSIDPTSLASKGDVSNLTIEGNEISDMASGGIGLVSFTFNDEDSSLSPVTDKLLICSNRIEHCAYGEGHVCHSNKGNFRLGGAIVLWMGAEIRLLDNQLLFNGRIPRGVGVVDAPYPVSGILAFYPRPGLLISRNLIYQNFSKTTNDPEFFKQPAAGISLFSPQSGGPITITDNKIENPGAALYFSKDVVGPTTIRVSGNYLEGSNLERNDDTDMEGAIFISDAGLEGSVLQFDNNYVVTRATNANPKPKVNFFSMLQGTIQIHNNHVVTWLNTPNVHVHVVNEFIAQHVTIVANHFICHGVMQEVGAHLQVGCDYILNGTGSANVSMNHCLESTRSMTTTPSILVNAHGQRGMIMAVANVTTNGVQLVSSTSSNNLANISGVFV